MTAEQAKVRLAHFAERRAISRLLTKLRYQEKTIDTEAARRIALAIAPNGALLPKEEGAWVFRTTFMQGAVLIRQLLMRLHQEQRNELALAVIQIAEPLPFAAECLRFMRYSKDDSAEELVLKIQSELIVGQALAARIRKAANDGPLYLSYGNSAPDLLWLWMRYGEPGQMEHVLRTWLSNSTDAVDKFLATYVGRAWGMESGLSRRSDFRRESYDRIAEIIDPEFIVERLRAAHGDLIEKDREDEPASEIEWEEQTARRFVDIHKFVLEGKEQADKNGGE
jgi:hypothetical protein